MEYKSLDKYEIKGIGTVFVVKNEVERNRDSNNLVGKKVIIDGIQHKVKGVESFCLPTIRKGDKIGLLV